MATVLVGDEGEDPPAAVDAAESRPSSPSDCERGLLVPIVLVESVGLGGLEVRLELGDPASSAAHTIPYAPLPTIVVTRYLSETSKLTGARGESDMIGWDAAACGYVLLHLSPPIIVRT